MKRTYGIVACIFVISIIGSLLCYFKFNEMEELVTEETKVYEMEENKEMVVDVDGQSFETTLYDSDTVRELMDRLPMTLRMDELHGNEKFYYLDKGLPTDSQQMRDIHAGDIMLFGSDCLVLFFKDVNTSYSYTKIGHIKDVPTFTQALKSGTVEVSFHVGE